VAAFAKALQHGLVLALARHRIAIEARDPRRRELAMQLILHLLRADTEKINMLALALRANAGHLLGVVAVVAEQAAVAAVKRHRHRAVHALDALAASPAGDEAGKAAP